MIEFQGDLETKSQEALGGKLIGDLHFNHDVSLNSQFSAYLIIYIITYSG